MVRAKIFSNLSTSQIGVMKNGINLIDDDKMKSELFASSFSSVFTRDNGLLPSFPSRTAAVIDDIVFEPFMVEHAFYKLIGKLNTTPDELPAFLLKKMCTAIAFPLCIIFNVSLKFGQLPEKWKMGIVVPLHKKGPRSDTGNYRQISLTSSVCKTLEKMVRREIVKHLANNQLIAREQYGF
uniref:Reverse transcriptase domain-containing protein n=1 Tax=Caenorhabditis japonica TaxID=281687 RepID=A0A8R1DGE8_CAEJA